MKLLILLHHRFDLWKAPEWFSGRLRKDFPQLEVVHLSSYDGLEDHLHDAEIVIAWSLRPEQFKTARKLRWIHSPAAAVHQLIFPELVNSDVILTNSIMILTFLRHSFLSRYLKAAQKETWYYSLM